MRAETAASARLVAVCSEYMLRRSIIARVESNAGPIAQPDFRLADAERLLVTAMLGDRLQVWRRSTDRILTVTTREGRWWGSFPGASPSLLSPLTSPHTRGGSRICGVSTPPHTPESDGSHARCCRRHSARLRLSVWRLLLGCH